jgi:hypothetical protein
MVGAQLVGVRRSTLLSAAWLVLTVASCGGNDPLAEPVLETGPSPLASSEPTAPATTAATSTPSTVFPPDSPAGQAQAALDNYWATIPLLLAAPDPGDPRLTQIAMGPRLDALRQQLGDMASQGKAARFEDRPLSVDSTIDFQVDDAAHFGGCVLDGGEIYDINTGKTSSRSIDISKVDGEMRTDSGVWKVYKATSTPTTSGSTICG